MVSEVNDIYVINIYLDVRYKVTRGEVRLAIIFGGDCRGVYSCMALKNFQGVHLKNYRKKLPENLS